MVWTWGCGDTEVWGCLGGNVGLNKKLASSPQPHAGESASRFFQVWNSYTERKRFQEISAPLKITSDFSSKSVCQPPAAKFLFFFSSFFFFSQYIYDSSCVGSTPEVWQVLSDICSVINVYYISSFKLTWILRYSQLSLYSLPSKLSVQIMPFLVQMSPRVCLLLLWLSQALIGSSR